MSATITPKVLARVAEAACLNPALDKLRQAFPGVHLSECSADDINTRLNPALETESHAFYLVSCPDGHCLSLTSEFEGATGIVVASKADD